MQNVMPIHPSGSGGKARHCGLVTNLSLLKAVDLKAEEQECPAQPWKKLKCISLLYKVQRKGHAKTQEKKCLGRCGSAAECLPKHRKVEGLIFNQGHLYLGCRFVPSFVCGRQPIHLSLSNWCFLFSFSSSLPSTVLKKKKLKRSKI